MSEETPMSRRELLRGRFVAGLFESATDRLTAGLDSNASDAEEDAFYPKIAGPVPPVMRYPKSGADVGSAAGAPSGRHGGTIPILRPPGAIAEERFLTECTRCDACVEACPHDAIVYAPRQFRAAAGTPMIDPDRAPCRMCEDLPCIGACEPDVLSHAVPIVMGTARITEQTCLAHIGTMCTVCSEHCPVEGAIEVSEGRPRIVEAVCTGCGVCRFVCPAPENAVLLMPAFSRPDRPAAAEDAND